jgi:hypothetical protein
MEISDPMAYQINKYLEQYEIDLRLTEENKPIWNHLIKNVITNLELRLTGPRMLYETALRRLLIFKEILDGDFNNHICLKKIDEIEKLCRINGLEEHANL